MGCSSNRVTVCQNGGRLFAGEPDKTSCYESRDEIPWFSGQKARDKSRTWAQNRDMKKSALDFVEIHSLTHHIIFQLQSSYFSVCTHRPVSLFVITSRILTTCTWSTPRRRAIWVVIWTIVAIPTCLSKTCSLTLKICAFRGWPFFPWTTFALAVNLPGTTITKSGAFPAKSYIVIAELPTVGEDYCDSILSL